MVATPRETHPEVWIMAILLFLAGCSGSDEGGPSQDAAQPAVSSESTDDASTKSAEADDANTAAEVAPSIEEILDIWERAEDTVFEPDGPSSSYTEILAPSDDGPWTIVGSIRDQATSRSHAAVWEFDELVWNGWERTDIDPLAADDDEFISDVTRFADVRVAAGSRGSGLERRAAIWVDQGNGIWNPVQGPEFDGSDIGNPERIFMLQVSPDNKMIVAIGDHTTEDGTDRTVIWTSSDSRSWDRVEIDELDQDDLSRPTSITVGANGIVAVGSAQTEDLQNRGRVWLRANGSTWTVVDPEAMATGYDVDINSVDRLGDGFVAVGSLRSEIDDVQQPASWTSPDGETWDGPFTSWELNDDGRSTTGGFGAWRVVADGDRLLATGSNAFMQHVWESTDGRRWNAVGNIWDVREAGVWLKGIASDGDAIVTVTDEPSVLVRGPEWTEIRLDKNATPSPTNRPYTNDLVWTPDGFVAGGGLQFAPGQLQHELESASWISPDGVAWDDHLSFGRDEWGPIGSVAVVDDQPFATVIETVEHAIANQGLGVGLALRPFDRQWSVFYELQDQDRRSAVTSLVQSGNDLVVGGWQFALDGTRTEARLGVVAVEDISDAQATPISLEAPGVWAGEGHHINGLCANQNGSVLAIGDGLLDSRGHSVLVAERTVDRTWTNQTALDESFVSHESQEAEVCIGGDKTMIAGWTFNLGDYDAAVWLPTADGHWQQVESEALGGDGDQWILDGIRVGDRYLLSGLDKRSGTGLATLWVGQGSDWTALPIGPEAWSLQSVEIASDVAGRAAADVTNSMIIIGGWQHGRTVLYHTTMSAIDEAVAAIVQAESQ